MERGELPLFDYARSRNTDPVTSHTAANEIQKSGALNKQRTKTLLPLHNWLRVGKGLPTSKELAQGDPELYHRYARRLPELKELGLVKEEAPRKCKETDRLALTWWLTDAGRDECVRLLNGSLS